MSHIYGEMASMSLASPIVNYQDLLQNQEGDGSPDKSLDSKRIRFEDIDEIIGPSFLLNDGCTIPAIALGTNFAHMDDPTRILPTDHKLARTIKYALDIGYRHLDTASVYRTEGEVGLGIQYFIKNNVAADRNDLFVTTKLWNDAHERDEVVPALQKSLRRLRLGYVDLYLIQYPFAYTKNGEIKLTDYIETWKGMQDAKELNLTKSIGVANFNLSQMQRLWDKAKIKPAVLQIELNPTIAQTELVNWCTDHGIVVMAYNPMGAIMKQRTDSPPIRGNHPLLKLIASKYKKTVPQVLLRYLIERNIVVISRSTIRSRIKENIDIFDFRLSPYEVAGISSFDCNYRIRNLVKWYPHPHFPFEKDNLSEGQIKHIIDHNDAF